MTRTLLRYGLFSLLLALLFSGCTINRDIMFRTSTDYQFDVFNDSVVGNLRLQRNDQIQFRLFANDGFKMIDLVSETGARDANWLQRTVFNYTIENDGLVKLPLLGRVKVTGLTQREAEAFLEEKYSAFYIKPYVQLVVTNRKVVVFPGGGGDARIVDLQNNNTTLLEVIGEAGGLSDRGNAKKVKVFRYNDEGKRLVYQFDLSDISGLKYADMVMQGDDVVYVQPNAELAREAIADLTPIITLLSSVLLVIAVTRNFQ
ncbi:MAG: polysaccharide biosynthesis/export family protein [Flavobacteriales bacterium]|nr:polysaccharide biosynthesis/export family protein [Flavobacteriales bacterium]